MNITIDDGTAAELAYIVELHQTHGAPEPQASVEDLVNTILAAIATGSRRPASWQRGLLAPLGMVAYSAEHMTYRQHNGRPVDPRHATTE